MGNIRTVSDLEERVVRALRRGEPLRELVPDQGVGVDVCLLHKETGRKIRKDTAMRNWDPLSSEISITFYEQKSDPTWSADEPERHVSTVPEGDPVEEVVRVLSKAEEDSALRFVALKWFRDKFLPEQVDGWTTSPEARQRAIAEAIERGWLLTGKVPNPKNPTFPVTSIRLNRPHPDVRRVLGSHQGSRDFSPVVIRGEDLSSTVIADRR